MRQFLGQLGVSIEVELEPKRTPGRDPRITELKLLVDAFGVLANHVS